MTKKTTEKSSVEAIMKDLQFVRGQYSEHKQNLEDARKQRLDAEGKLGDATLNETVYQKAGTEVKKLNQIVAESIATERCKEIALESCRTRIRELEENLNKAKERELKIHVKKFGQKLTEEAPGLEQLLQNFTDRLNEILDSSLEVNKELTELGSNYSVRGPLNKVVSRWLANRMWKIFPNTFEVPPHVPGKGRRVGDLALRKSLETLFESIVNDSKLTIESPFIASDGLDEIRVVPVSEKLREQAVEMRGNVAV